MAKNKIEINAQVQTLEQNKKRREINGLVSCIIIEGVLLVMAFNTGKLSVFSAAGVLFSLFYVSVYSWRIYQCKKEATNYDFYMGLLVGQVNIAACFLVYEFVLFILLWGIWFLFMLRKNRKHLSWLAIASGIAPLLIMIEQIVQIIMAQA